MTSKFFDFGGNDLFNLDKVWKIEFSDGGEKGHKYLVRLFLDDDSVIDFRSPYGKDDVSRYLAPVIPATAGYEFLEYWFEDTKPSLSRVKLNTIRTPIVAWRLDYNEYPDPVAIDSVSADDVDSYCGTMCPDGRVIKWGDRFFETFDRWAEAVLDRWDEWHKTKKQRKKSA